MMSKIKFTAFCIIIISFSINYFGCKSKQIKEIDDVYKNALLRENEKCKDELESSRKRCNELELYVDDLKDQVRQKDNLLQKEISRVEDTHKDLLDGLKKEIAKEQIVINNYRGILTLNVADKLFFDSGQAILKKEGKDLLLKIGEILKHLPEKMIRIEGHTDDIPIAEQYRKNYPSNWELGAIRAVNVVKFLQTKAAIDPTRLSAVSFSEYRPIKPNSDEEGRSKNRRIEIIIIDKKLYQMIEVKEGFQE